ncbi:MAG: hypothetical protein ACPG5T_01830, partial [Endozoicomonas sp.]
SLWLGSDQSDAWSTQGRRGAFLGLGGDDQFIVKDFSWDYLGGGEGEDRLEFAHDLPEMVVVDGAQQQVTIGGREKGLFADFETLVWHSTNAGRIIPPPGVSRIQLHRGNLDILAGGDLTHINVLGTGNVSLESSALDSVVVSCVPGHQGVNTIRLKSDGLTVSDIMVERFQPVESLQGAWSDGDLTLACFVTFQQQGPLPEEGTIPLFEFFGVSGFDKISIGAGPHLDLWIKRTLPEGQWDEQSIPDFFRPDQKVHVLVTFHQREGQVYKDGKRVYRFIANPMPQTVLQMQPTYSVLVDTLVFIPLSVGERTAQLLASSSTGQMLRLKYSGAENKGIVVYGGEPEWVEVNDQRFTLTNFMAQAAVLSEPDIQKSWHWPEPEPLDAVIEPDGEKSQTGFDRMVARALAIEVSSQEDSWVFLDGLPCYEAWNESRSRGESELLSGSVTHRDKPLSKAQLPPSTVDVSCEARNLSVASSFDEEADEVTVDLERQSMTSQAYQWLLEGTEKFRWNTRGAVFLQGGDRADTLEFGPLAQHGKVRSGRGDDDIVHASSGTMTYEYEPNGGQDFIQILGTGDAFVNLGEGNACERVAAEEVDGLVTFKVPRKGDRQAGTFYVAGPWDPRVHRFHPPRITGFQCGSSTLRAQKLEVLIQSINAFKGEGLSSASVSSLSNGPRTTSFVPTTTFAG